MALYGNPNVTGHERFFDKDDIIVTKTDLKGKITYGNRTFYKMAGYSEKECLGVQHNLIRHPHMPRCIFNLLWLTLAEGQEVFAYVNNRSKNGDHYWVLAHITPSFDVDNKIIGYHSSRRLPDPEIVNKKIVPLYDNLLELEKSIESPSKGMEASTQAVVDLLAEKKMSFNEFTFSLGG